MNHLARCGLLSLVMACGGGARPAASPAAAPAGDDISANGEAAEATSAPDAADDGLSDAEIGSALGSLEAPAGDRAAAVGVLKVGDSQVQGSLTKDEIRATVRRSLSRLRFCYEQELVAKPGLQGKAQSKFTIGPDGKVTDAAVSGFGDAAVEQCLEAAVRAMVFPPPKGGGIVIVNYPFVFATADAGASTDGKADGKADANADPTGVDAIP